MIAININDIYKSYGGTSIINGLSLEFSDDEKVGIIGDNGTGKTTLFKLIANIESCDSGNIFRKKGLTVGYLNQIPVYPDELKVMDVLKLAFEDLENIYSDMKKLEDDMGKLEGELLQRTMNRYSELQKKYETLGGYEVSEKLSKVIVGMKFDEVFLKRDFQTLSGGEKTKVSLAKILLEEPEALLLDEPTNHLDLDSLEWLEEYIRGYKGLVAIISHDRHFLDRTITRVIEIANKTAKSYIGNYSLYKEQKRIELELNQKSYENQQKQIKKMEEAIVRFKVWGSVQGEEMFFKKARNMEKRIDKLDKVEKIKVDNKMLNLNINDKSTSGKEVLNISELEFGFADKKLFVDFNMLLRKGESAVLMGGNGTGKSTLLKMINSELGGYKGTIRLGSNVKIGYLEQEIYFEENQRTVIEHFNTLTMKDESYCRRTLAKYKFTDDDVFKKLESLSGGEKVRLQLALMLEDEINFLILDEPTNHIDIKSREMLEESLNNFTGSILIVSHDRYFIRKLADIVMEIENKKLTVYQGDYEYYREEKQKREAAASSMKEIEKAEKEKLEKEAVKNLEVIEEKDREEGTKPKKINTFKLKEIEKKMKALEEEIAKKEQEILDNPSSYSLLTTLNAELQVLHEKLEEETEKWFEVQE